MATILNNSYNNSNYNKYFELFSYDLRDFQKHAIEGIVLNKNVLVIASTGNGKTVCCENAKILIMTTEILHNMLLRTDQQSFLNDVACIIFDEAHYINDSKRGKIW